MKFTVWIPGRPVAKPQHYTKGSHKQWEWRKKVAWMARSQMVGVKPTLAPVALGMMFYVAKRGEIRPPDFKNLWACAEDALKQVVYVDDWQVDTVIPPSGRRIVQDKNLEGLQLTVDF